MANEMIARVARALVKAGLPLCDEIECAKAAIAAMREPTDDMICNVGRIVVNNNGYPKPLVMSYEIKAAYRAMIDAALKE